MPRCTKSSILFAASAAMIFAQTPAPAGEVVGVGNFSHIVSNLNRSLEFYRDVLGLEMPAPPRPFDPNPAIMKLGNTIGAQSRFVALRVPGSALGVEIIDYKDIDRKPARPRFQDPGAANLILMVRNLDSVLARLKKAGAHFLTPGGRPTVLEGKGTKTQVVFVQDPDGFVIELSQRDPAPATAAPVSSNVIGSNFEISISDTDRTAHFYREGLGFRPQVGASFDGDKVRTDTAGTPGAEYRQSRVQIPGTSVSMAFIEFRRIRRSPLHTRVQDPGTAILQLRVRDVDSVLKATKAAGGTIISAGGEPVSLGNFGRLAIVRDPNNLFLELIQSPQTAQPR